MRITMPPISCQTHKYGDHYLQRLGVWQTAEQKATASSGPWLIFIHGGAWRDPRLTYRDFEPSIQHILASQAHHPSSIAGFASIDYRLSSHPDFPQDPTTTTPTELRAASHPDPVLDVRAALRYLDEKFAIGHDYILIGHSAGATLSFQLLMGQVALEKIPLSESPAPPLPASLIGISGIYDLIGINDRHDGQYAGFISAAFTNDQEVWRRASPALFPGNYSDVWSNPQNKDRTVLLAWSAEDGLIDEADLDDMAAKLRQDGLNPHILKDLTGEHDFVWQDGSQVSRLVDMALKHREDQTQ